MICKISVLFFYVIVTDKYQPYFPFCYRYNPDLETIDIQGKSILYICCQSKDSRCFYKIIHEHPKFSQKVMDSRASDRTNAVIVASQQGNSEQLKYLLDNGVSQVFILMKSQKNVILPKSFNFWVK